MYGKGRHSQINQVKNNSGSSALPFAGGREVGKEGNKNEFTPFLVRASSTSERIRKELIIIVVASRKEMQEAGRQGSEGEFFTGCPFIPM